MKQPHHALNTLNNNQHLVVAFNVDLPDEVKVLSCGTPRLFAESKHEVTVSLVPAPTEGPGRFALDFVPAFNTAFGHYAVDVEIDVVIEGDGDVTLDRTIHFFVLRPSGDGISVTPQSPLDQDAVMQAASTLPSGAIEEYQDAPSGTGVLGPVGQPETTPREQQPEPSTGVQQSGSNQPPAPLTDEQRATAQQQAGLNQAAADQPAAGEQPQI